jgi:hypothetical protein
VTLRHLLALGIDDEAVVHPVTGKSATQCHRLCTLVFMVREAKVCAATVQIKTFT